MGVSKEARIVLAVLGALVLIAVLVNAAQGGGDSDEATDLSGLTNASVDVTYYLDGSANKVGVTMQTPGGTSQRNSVVPNRIDPAGTFSRGDFVYISAQIDQYGGSVTCRIEVNGLVVSENTSSGAHSIVSCEGNA